MTQVFIVSGTSWSVPSDWSNTNLVETIGGGGAGGTQANGTASGGGGGGYASSTNLTGLSGSVTIQVGSGGAGSTGNGNAGGSTWFNGATVGGASVSAYGGGGGAGGADAAGGAGGAGVNGTTTYTGGAGGEAGSQYGAGGGGGAAGPIGNGASGGAANQTNLAGGGGGGGNGGGTAGGSGSGQYGGGGGNNSSRSGGGTAGGGNGSNGGGGGGATGTAVGGSGEPGAGGSGTEWSASYGSGGGGGGGSSWQVNPAIGGAGGLYGGGGGGTGNDSSGGAGAGGAGAQGIIVVTYTPTAGTTVTAEDWAAGEVESSTRPEQLVSIESGARISGDIRLPSGLCGSAQGSGACGIGYLGTVGTDLRLPAECAGAVLLSAELLARFEVGAFLHADAIGQREFASRTVCSVSSRAEWGSAMSSETGPAIAVPFWLEFLCALISSTGSSNEILASGCREGLLALESLSGGVPILVEGLGMLEWADPPALLLLSPGRLLRSSGRIRILAGLGSVHPLRDQ